MDLKIGCKALSSDTRLKIIKIIIEKGPLSSKEVHSEFIKRHENKRRESIYKGLEILREANILEKQYDDSETKIVYKIMNEKLKIDLVEMELKEA